MLPASSKLSSANGAEFATESTKDSEAIPIVGSQEMLRDEVVRLTQEVEELRLQLQKRGFEVANDLQTPDLARIDRLRSVVELLANVEHEINQPLAAASNFARACAHSLKSGRPTRPEQLIDWIEKSAEQAERAAEIVSRIAKFSGRITLHPKEFVDINRVIENVVAQGIGDGFPNVFRCPVPQLNFDESIPKIAVVKGQIGLVLLHLIRNATEAMNDLAPHDRLLMIRTSQSQDRLEVAVSDNGRGLSEEIIKQLFNPFFSTKPDGLGLGLAMAQTIMESFGGKISATSNPSEGATFTLSLPIKR